MKTVLRSIVIGSAKHVVLGTTDAEVDAALGKIVTQALKAGSTVEYPDGRKVWRERKPLMSFKAEGSAVYTWHEDGNRVRCELVEYEKSPKGVVTSRKLRLVWAPYAKV